MNNHDAVVNNLTRNLYERKRVEKFLLLFIFIYYCAAHKLCISDISDTSTFASLNFYMLVLLAALFTQPKRRFGLWNAATTNKYAFIFHLSNG